ncbi:MAG: (d)CMP kinase [Actinomycetia bacterium]|nr:(d)CMP kinase [Actinomycetes bacterium]
MVVAIDGPSGVGKSTVSRAVAIALNLAYLDTGSTYRAATLAVLNADVDIGDGQAVLEVVRSLSIDYGTEGVLLDGVSVAQEVRTDRVTSKVSTVSAHPEVRAEIVAVQRAWVARHGGDAVVEGRDIGTVVFPDTRNKIYLTARQDVRAARRARDDEAREASVAEIAAALQARDEADSTRKASPLRPASDATIIDTSDIGIEQVVEAVLDTMKS